MHDRKSLYSRNKRNSRAILCPDAFEQDHPLTPEQFSSEEEFRFWKTWSDEDYHNWELADHIYAINGVEFTYLRVADIRTYTEEENGASHVEVLYGIAQNEANDAFLSAIGVSAGDRYAPADLEDGTVYFYRSDTLVNGLKSALASNAITVKNALERFVRENGGTAMPLTDSYGQDRKSVV